VKRLLIRLLIILFGIGTTVTWIRVYDGFKPPLLYRKDFIQLYLMGKAAAFGLPVYTPLAELARIFDPDLGAFHQHSSAYPPTTLLFFRIFADLSYIRALLLWDIIELISFVIASLLILRELRSRTTLDRLALVIVASVLWPPFLYDLYHGQLMMTILLLVTGTWLSLKSGRDNVAGIFLGVLLALKLYAWPIWLFLMLKRKYRPVICAIVVFLLLNFITIIWLGLDSVLEYYLHVAPAISLIYRTHTLNFSLFALGATLVGAWFGAILVLLVLVLSLGLAWRAPDFDHAFMIMVAVAIIAGPVSWVHYLITLLPALCLVVSWKEMQMREKVLIAILFYLAVPEIYESFLSPRMVALIPAFFVLGLILLLSRALASQNVIDKMLSRSTQRVADGVGG
jgi:hypothetical protein